MSPEEIIQHWIQGARDALEMAQLAASANKYDHALFNCQLAVEKGLKVLYMKKNGKDAARTHDLLYLGKQLDMKFAAKEMKLLEELSDFAVEARYHDPLWSQQEATKENATYWIAATQTFLALHLP